MADVRGDELELLIEGARYTGWTSVEVLRSLEAASGAFSVGVSGRDVPIRTGSEVTVRLAGMIVARGHVDIREARGSFSDRALVYGGRDRTADLVDCSELSEPGEWHDLSLLELVQRITSPFAVEVRSELEDPGEPFLRFARNPGETAWSAIERACRLRAVLAHASGDGALVLARAGADMADVALVEGSNVLEWSNEENQRQRFQTYTVRAQHPGADDFYGDAAALIEATSSDPAVDRFRPLLVLAEGPLAFEGARDRAQWEASVRAARSHVVTVTVQGWRQKPGGRVWELNERAHVLIPGDALDLVLLVSQVRFVRDRERGTLTELALTRPDAYLPQPEVDQDPFDEEED